MDCRDLERFDEVGALHLPGAAIPVLDALGAALAAWPDGQSGTRIAGDGAIRALLGPSSEIGELVAVVAGKALHPVRAVYFDKNETNNWALGWHQDRTIAVRERVELSGFGPWTVKQGILHVQPPFAVIAGLRTIRIHLDPVPRDNAPLLVAPGSHRLGLVAAERCSEVAAASPVIACLAEAGDIWVYHTAILHASERSKHPDRRRVLQVDYAAGHLSHPLEWLGV